MERWTPRERHGFVFGTAARWGALVGASEGAWVLVGPHAPVALGAKLTLGLVSVALSAGVAAVLSVLAGPFGDDTVRGVSRQVALALAALTALLVWERFGWALADASRGAALAWALAPTVVAGGVYGLLARRAEAMRAAGARRGGLASAGIAVVILAVAALASPPTHALGPSALLITTEGLRAEDVGKGVYPHVDRLAKEATTFTQAVTPSTSTAVAHAALWTDRHPLTLPMVRDDQPLPADAATLAEAARPTATTAAFVSTTALSDVGLDRGFDVFDDSFTPLPGLDRLALVRWARGVAWLRRPPTDTAEAAAAWLVAHRDGRFLLWVHLALPPSSVRDGRDQASLDAAIGEVLDALGPAADRTFVAVVGVRGARRTPGATPWAGLADDVVRVPMIVRAPNATPSKVDAQASILRVTTELAASGGWTLPGDAGAAKPTDAASLATTVLGDDGVGHARLALRQLDLKLIVDPDSKDASYYDLTLDPGETTDRSGTAPEFVLKARMSLAPELAALTRAREVASLGSWRARRLRALAEE